MKLDLSFTGNSLNVSNISGKKLLTPNNHDESDNIFAGKFSSKSIVYHSKAI